MSARWSKPDRHGHMDDTLILTLSDKRPTFPGAKTTTYEPGIKLPLIVRHPQQQKRGVVSDAGVNWTDLMPTILDFAGRQSSRWSRRQKRQGDRRDTWPLVSAGTRTNARGRSR